MAAVKVAAEKNRKAPGHLPVPGGGGAVRTDHQKTEGGCDVTVFRPVKNLYPIPVKDGGRKSL